MCYGDAASSVYAHICCVVWSAETKQGVLHVTMVVVCVTAMVLQVLCGCTIAAQHGQSVKLAAGVTVVMLHVLNVLGVLCISTTAVQCIRKRNQADSVTCVTVVVLHL